MLKVQPDPATTVAFQFEINRGIKQYRQLSSYRKVSAPWKMT